MSDLLPGGPGQDDAALAPELARLDELLLAEGQRWRRNEPSTARLERHVWALARTGVTLPRNEERMLTERNQARDTSAPRLAPQRPPSRWRGPLAAVATVLLIAMAATVFAFLSSGRSAGKGTDQRTAKATPTPSVTRITAIQPPNTFLPMPANVYLSGLSFSSAHDGWAVGGIRIPDQPGQNFSAARGVLVHYHDGVWMSSHDSFPGVNLASVSMVSADEGWTVGSTINPPDNSGGVAVLLHYTGGHWAMVKTPALLNAYPDTIRMLSPDFGYITGVVNVHSTTAQGSTNWLDEVVVYQNGVWKAIRTPFAEYTSQVVMTSAGEGWAAANENGQGVVYHYLNGVWTKALAFPGSADSISSASVADVWALGRGRSLCVATAKKPCSPNSYIPVIYHYNGSAWSRVNPPGTTNISFGSLSQQFIFDGAASGVWLTFATQDASKPPTQRPYTTTMWVNRGDGWLRASQPIAGAQVFALAADGNGGSWAIAETDTPYRIAILYTQGNVWKIYGRSW